MPRSRRPDPRWSRRRGPYITGLVLPEPEEGEVREGYPWDLPAARALGGDGLDLHPKVTYFVGENGSGKSTLLEAVAVAAGMNPEGGSSNFAFATRESHSPLAGAITLRRGLDRPESDFFLRAESLFTTASYLESLPRTPTGGGDPLGPYGGRSLHEQSHGESFLAVMLYRFGPRGLYLLDEPEAALSAQNCLTLLSRIHQLAGESCQFIIATHSPLVLAYPDALIYEFGTDGPAQVAYDDADLVRLTRGFLDAPERFLAELLGRDRPAGG
jgi:predicted ATPase